MAVLGRPLIDCTASDPNARVWRIAPEDAGAGLDALSPSARRRRLTRRVIATRLARVLRLGWFVLYRSHLRLTTTARHRWTSGTRPPCEYAAAIRGRNYESAPWSASQVRRSS